MRTRNRRLTVTIVAVTTLLLSTVGVGLADEHTTPTDDPVDAAAGWLATQLVEGERMEATFGDDVFPDAGLTADVVYALAGAGVASGSIASATDWLETQVGLYTGAGGDAVFAGATAKLLLVAATTGRPATDFGGVDLVAQLEDLEQDADDASPGRFSDAGDDDWSNTITQALALLALERTADGPSPEAVTYLVDQACDDGGFPSELEPDTCTSSIDGTAFAVQALLAVDEADAAAAGVAWLVDVQQDDGGFVGDEGANTNSTGLAALALSLAGEQAAADAAGDWILSLQLGCEDDAPGAIPFAPDDPGDMPRATAQAVPGLTGVGLATVSAEGASGDVPLLDCPTPVEDEPEEVEETAPEETDPVDEVEEDTLPETGTDRGVVALLAAALLVAGVLLVGLTRRGVART